MTGPVLPDAILGLSTTEAAKYLEQLGRLAFSDPPEGAAPDQSQPGIELRYQTLVDQIPAVVFLAPLDSGVGESYVSNYVQSVLGYTQQEWLGDPLRWYQRIHPDDRARWSQEAAELFLTGEPLRSTYRVIARDSRVIWFQCE